jgi:tetratricopeptide (TPR) repeat protein
VRRTWILLLGLFLVMGAYAASALDQWQKGKEAFDKGDYGKAVQYFKKAAESGINEAANAGPGRGDYFRWLGVAYWKNKQYQEAIDACQKALSLPHSQEGESECWWSLADSQERLGQIESALASCKKYIELKSDDPIAFSTLSGLCIKNKQFDEAISAAKRAIELNPNNAWAAWAYRSLGLAYQNMKQYDESIDAFRKATELDPDSAVYPYNLGGLYYDRGAYAEASLAFRKAVELQPKNVNYLWAAANVSRLMGKYDEALSFISEAIEKLVAEGAPLTENAAVFFALRSAAHRYKGSVESAAQDAEKAYSLNPTNNWALQSLGAVYLDLGRYDESVELLSEVKNNPRVRILEATAKARQGKIQEAEDIYFSIPENDMTPNNVPLMADRAALLQVFKPLIKEHRDKATSFEAKGQFKEALSELSEALKTADDTESPAIRDAIFGLVRKRPSLSELPEDARKHALKGEMLIKEGSFEQAGTEIQAAIHMAPYVAQLYYNSALVQAQLKNYSEAIRQMKIYVQAVPDAPDARAAKDAIIKWELLMEKKK